MMTLGEFADALEAIEAEVNPQMAIVLERVGALAVSLAAEYPGTYQRGWAPLAESTLEDKAQKGFPVPSPLKRTGEMAASYADDVDPLDLTLTVGSPDKIALYQEMGTSKIPPRPVVKLAIQNAMPYARDEMIVAAKRLLSGKTL